ncbi:MAG: SDR family NAD(P)-dependent oxidoreductase [Puniceicoccaceae bacterium]
MKPKSDFLGACQFMDSVQNCAAMGTPRLANKYRTALITGASSGLGLAFARMLANEGVKVSGTTRDPSREGLDPGINWIGMEGNSMVQVDHFVEKHKQLLSSIDILINNAGSSYFSRESPNIKDLSSGQQNLLYGTPVRLTQEALAGMRRREFGAIVNVSSLAALFPLPYMAGYSAGKAGLSAYTQGLMIVEKDAGVTLIDFQAGDYKTAFNANIRKDEITEDKMQRVWNRLEENMLSSPEPERAARDLRRALIKGRSGIVRSGGFFQSRFAPFGMRLLPSSLVRKAIRSYYGIG